METTFFSPLPEREVNIFALVLMLVSVIKISRDGRSWVLRQYVWDNFDFCYNFLSIDVLVKSQMWEIWEIFYSPFPAPEREAKIILLLKDFNFCFHFFVWIIDYQTIDGAALNYGIISPIWIYKSPSQTQDHMFLLCCYNVANYSYVC